MSRIDSKPKSAVAKATAALADGFLARLNYAPRMKRFVETVSENEIKNLRDLWGIL
jgi:hypothetical protein